MKLSVTLLTQILTMKLITARKNMLPVSGWFTANSFMENTSLLFPGLAAIMWMALMVSH